MEGGEWGDSEKPRGVHQEGPNPGLGFVSDNNPLPFHGVPFIPYALVKTLLLRRRKVLKNGDSQGLPGGGRGDRCQITMALLGS